MQHQLNMLKNNSGVKTKSMYKSNFKLHYPLLVTAVVIGSAAIASPSSLTQAVIGHKPTVDNVLLDKTAAVLGDTLNVTYDYQDIDGDADASTLLWLKNGLVVAGQTGKRYTIPQLNTSTGTGNACDTTPFQIAVEVTPQSQKGDPKTGEAKQSVATQVNVATIPNFTFPDTVLRTWSVANAFCVGKGLRLPTRAELLAVYTTYTNGGGGTNEMAGWYGWPMSGQCGGSVNTYWTSEPGTSGNHYFINMYLGVAFNRSDTTTTHVTCVR
ncbi:hypothetical protein ACET9I_19465 [Aeromonas veronii]